MRLESKTAFITGAGSGLGRAASLRFAKEGATIVAADIDIENAETTAEKVRDLGQDATAYEVDVTDTDTFTATVDATAEEFGLDIILNNAGISHGRSDMEEIGYEARDRVIDVNINGVWNGCQAAIPHFKSQGSGAIVNTASLAGVIGAPGLTAYSLTKGAVVNFTRAIAAELGPAGIRANAVCPAITETAMTRSDLTDEEWEEREELLSSQYPLRRLGQPSDIANAMLYLASDEASWVTGQALVVDGGFSCA